MNPCICNDKTRNHLHCIIPPYVLERLSESSNPKLRKLAVQAIEAGAQARTTRAILSQLPMALGSVPSSNKKNRLIYDVKGQGQSSLPGKLVRKEGDASSSDPAVNEAYDFSGTTYDFYFKLFGRRSLDNKGISIVSSVHLLNKFNNAFWNGQQMAYGDGDGTLFLRFTKSLDVVGHELTHGVVSNECNLVYQGQSGALNEHFADAFGVMVKQWKLKQTALKADWLVGSELMAPQSGVKSIRTFAAGKAFENNRDIGTDMQPKHMRDLFTGSSDNGGVHINSGIPNHAFYLFARSLKGNCWDVAGSIWYEAMRKLSSDSVFTDMVATTEMIAVKNHGAQSSQHQALQGAWRAVGL